MKLQKIRPNSIALMLTAILVIVVGTSTDNDGFLLAGVLILAGGVALAYRQATS